MNEVDEAGDIDDDNEIARGIVGTELGPQRPALETQYENGTITSAHV